MIRYFKDLGESIEKQWLLHGYDEEAFPQLAVDALSTSPPHQNVGTKLLLDWSFKAIQPFRQPNNSELFGEPPLTLYQGPRFYIEALFWFSGTTAIHEHSFSGAFAVLAGSSVHSHWRFSKVAAINSRMLHGHLERESTEILGPGGVRSIRSGDRLIHQLFHLEVPSITIVVRTYVDRHHLPQYRYLIPGLATDDSDRDPNRIRRLMFIGAMARGQLEGLEAYCRQWIEEGDLESLYYLFATLTFRKIDAHLLETFYQLARERHGATIDIFRDACAWQRRERVVSLLRNKVEQREPRLLLALLMLMPNRDAIFEVIRLQYPATEPMAMIESWLEGMSKDTIGFPFDATNQTIFRGLVEGCTLEEILGRLEAEFEDSSVAEHREKVVEHARKVARSDLFYPLFSQSPLRDPA